MQVPLLSGIVASPAAEFIRTWPLNLEPVAIDSKISKSQFRAPPGAISTATGDGRDRGGIVWSGRHYRVMGTKLYEASTNGELTLIGDVGGNLTRCALDYSFDRLIIASGLRLSYFDGESLTVLTDPDLGDVVDAIWIDGYTMTTDGIYAIVTELSDPMQVKPLKYGSAETDPDPITGLLRYSEEAYVLGRNTIQVFRNVGGSGFPFAPIDGGTIPFGCVSAQAKCLFSDGFAFVGSARGEALNVYIGGKGTAQPFGNKALCDALAAVKDETAIELEARVYGAEQRLVIHLPDESWCFLANASRDLGEPIWYRLKTGAQPYRLRHMVEAHGKMWVGDSQGFGNFGYLTDQALTHWGVEPDWQFEAGLLYNSGQGAIVHSVELIGLPGRGGASTIFLSRTRDGETWTTERELLVELGQRGKRMQWRPHVKLSNYMGFRFRGTGTMLPGIAALEVRAQALGA